ncbi:uncharacterized protein LOC144201903 isoform X2 [Stigmatopora nigra]
MTPEEGRVCVRALQSSSKVTICRRNPAKLLTERCCTFYPQRAQTAGKHQECGQNDQKGATCRRHNKNSTRGWRRFDFLRCWSTNGNQSMKFFKIKGGGEDSIFYDAVTPAGTYLQTFSK